MSNQPYYRYRPGLIIPTDQIPSERPVSLPTNQLEKRTEPFYGWRFWRLTKDCYLQSAVRDTVWPRYKPMSVDDPNWCAPFYEDDTFIYKHELPNGLHAFKYRTNCFNELSSYLGYLNAREKEQLVIGTVALWGRVHEYSKGYRAEFGYPTKFLVPDEMSWETIMELEDGYGVPAEYASDFPKAPPTYKPLWTTHPPFFYTRATTPSPAPPNITRTATGMVAQQALITMYRSSLLDMTKSILGIGDKSDEDKTDSI